MFWGECETKRKTQNLRRKYEPFGPENIHARFDIAWELEAVSITLVDEFSFLDPVGVVMRLTLGFVIASLGDL
jgi:hypothetical protein